MLVIIEHAIARLLSGGNPYAIHHVPWDAPLAHGPALWLPFVVPHVLEIDPRLCENQRSLGDHTTATDLPPIRQLSAAELKALIESGTPFELVDVRTPEERAIARIEGSRLLDQAYHDALLTLDRDTPIVFQCHHGIRSQHAAEYFRCEGFRNLHNLRGGIDSWSLLVDAFVQRY